ncbi:MAG: hypothetical protein ACYTF8_18385 [Planctomycetota bacterium]
MPRTPGAPWHSSQLRAAGRTVWSWWWMSVIPERPSAVTGRACRRTVSPALSRNVPVVENPTMYGAMSPCESTPR